MVRRVIAAGCLLFSAALAHAGQAGKLIFVAGAAQLAQRGAVEGAAVQEGDLLTTGSDGFIYVKTIDDGLLILRPNSSARIVSYHVDRVNPANTRVKLELLRGVARTQSGSAVKQARQNFRFNTPVAAIGVRGTDFTVFTDQDTSRVAVLSGGVVVSGFVGNCSPEGGGPCEGVASRELSAHQRGQLLQVRRGQAAPQLLQDSTMAPDQIAPPRADEPGGKGTAAGGLPTPAAAPSIDPTKTGVLVPPPPTGASPAPQPVPAPEPVPAPTPAPEPAPVPAPPEPVVVTPPVVPPVVEPPVVVPPPQPERQIVWGRWQPLIGQPATVDVAAQMQAKSEIIAFKGAYVLMASAGKDYVPDTRGSVGFALRDAQAYISEGAAGATPARIENGQLVVNFDNRTFSTGFDLVSSSNEVFKLHSEGVVGATGRLHGEDFYKAPTNISLDGMLSGENGGSASYIFDGRLDAKRTAYGITYWGVRK